MRPSAERSSQGHLDHLLGEMRSAVRESGEAADANRRARNQRQTLRDLHRQAQALEQLGFLVQDLGLLLDDHDSGGGSQGSAPQARLPAAQGLRALADAVRAVAAGRSDQELTGTAADAVDHLATTLRSHLVMELAVGLDLKSRLVDGAMARRDVGQIGVDLAEGLDYVHDHGVIHRDVKPRAS